MSEKLSTNAQDIVAQLKKQISSFAATAAAEETGRVRQVGDGIASISGLSKASAMEMIEFENGIVGVALNLEEDVVGAVILGRTEGIEEGQSVKATGRILSIPVGKMMTGRVINPLGEAIDGKGKISSKELYPIEKVAPGVMTREPVNRPLMTGIKAIDSMIPIGRGQRELIIGDRQTGKTAIAVDTILNQKGQSVHCIYVAIGQKESKVAKIVQRLKDEGAMDYTTVVVAGASDPASLQFIAPYAGVTIGEWFMDRGEDVLVIYDDLSKHAWSYREFSLLLRRPPGREAYPGDVFYLHSRLLERAARRNAQHGGGSITALPIIETQAGDVSAYIPTNVISITDGQIYLESDLFYKGIRPAVNVGLSVSRVGGAAQTKVMKKVSGQLRLDLAQFRELEAFSQFATDLDETTRKQIERGRRTVEVLKQGQYQPMEMSHQVAVIYAVTKGFLDVIPVERVLEWEQGFHAHLDASEQDLIETLREKAVLDERTETLLKQAIERWNSMFL
ncbi:F0F1 ATP synthase subunit alpha [Patescibacteria group bacterium]|uniref:ATP synthase subunit alpha n=1 Tax=candidate division WWE3 bacterium TaxID=2053526 RepID=A0A928TRG5_UNCKA|nr:F0F1 ATP synthase subunit alpha [candidate division WWE3 bacterium]MCL4732275.1 F0F1 ATP synthase subunit alpha [Patescibacteria group bacterium]MDL1953174.1 F0F1 ATP synthase subunit alpha [Candidatus Uhrbacteria bacterium UHB]RIL00370.1 MAG: F0F1 ATP synthase subunit alpha [Candidatus Uhrbacteria bacterium]